MAGGAMPLAHCPLSLYAVFGAALVWKDARCRLRRQRASFPCRVRDGNQVGLCQAHRCHHVQTESAISPGDNLVTAEGVSRVLPHLGASSLVESIP